MRLIRIKGRYFIVSLASLDHIYSQPVILEPTTMKKVVFSNSITLGGSQLKINGSEKMGCYEEILSAIKNQLDAMLSHHSRVLIVRIDLHTSEYNGNNEMLSQFIRRLRKRLKQRYNLRNVGYVWVREIEKAKSQHYHLALVLDGNKVNYPAKVIKLVEEIWQGTGNPKPYTPEKCYYLIKRGQNYVYKEAFRRLSYLAKKRGKGYKSKTANDYSTSRIKPKNKPDT